MLIKQEEITIEGFKQLFFKIIEIKERAGITAILNNPPDLFERAKLYGTRFKNNAWGWASNIWHRSAAGSVVIERDEDLKTEHKFLMMRVLEHILAQGPLIQVDCYLGSNNSPVKMHARLYCDPQFPDIAYRWTQINFPAPPEEEPDVMLIDIPHYLGNQNVPGTNQMLRVIRFPCHDYTIVTCSSYQGEVKKGFLSHWIYYVYKKGGCGEHAALKEFTIKKIDGKSKRIVMCVWGLTGTGKSTHGMYIFGEHNKHLFIQQFDINPTEYVSDQVIRNDDIVAIFEDRVYGSERGSWTKTEDVTEFQLPLLRAAMSPRALHENTEFGPDGNPNLEGKLFQYQEAQNRNARSVFNLEDTGYFDGQIDSSDPLNMAVFISPGNFCDYAWVKIEDLAFAAKVLADGRTVGHPAQSLTVVGKELYESRYCLPFTMGVGNAAHVVRFYEILKKRKEKDNPVDLYLLTTVGKIGSEYEWVEEKLGGKSYMMPRSKLKTGSNGIPKPIGGTSPTIEETELFLLQAAREAVEYEPHPIWGEKVFVPIEVEGISKERLSELNPFTYRSMEEIRELIKAQIIKSKYYLSIQCLGLPEEILNAMNF
ncbi:MAG: phosphoenolpyruvate carboxykinase (ATP) [archaeon]|nr:phosphoenolpyruvate carboxykinase (ATP) [archaeon]